jgi:hypothetical protein
MLVLSLNAFSSPKVKAKELDVLTGARWTGNLIYLDYSSSKKVSILSDLIVSKSSAKNSWSFAFEYPKEPKANSSEIVLLSNDGKMLDGEMVVEKTLLTDKTLKIVTQKEGMDNDKKAIFRHTYLVGEKSFSIKKEVKYIETGAEFFERNEYSWTR